MKKIIDYIGLFCWIGILLIHIISLARGQEISQITSITAIVFCILYSIEQVLANKKRTAEKNTEISDVTERE